MSIKVIESMDQLQIRARLYAESLGQSDGGQIDTIGFMLWISEQWRVFEKEQGKNYLGIQKSESDHRDFDEWLKKRVRSI